MSLFPDVTVAQSVSVSIDGQPAAAGSLTRGEQAVIGLTTTFPNGHIFYALSGPEVSVPLTLYSGPFTLTNSASLTAVAYSAVFDQSVSLTPLCIVIVPTYTLDAVSGSGGSIRVEPLLPRYLSNSVVNLTAVPASGWTFARWSGDATETTAALSVTLDGNKSFRAIFATDPAINIAGSGSVLRKPVASPYEYGSTLRLQAVPQDGFYFALWGGAITGDLNPFEHSVTNASTIGALFLPVIGDQVTLTAIEDGPGRVTRIPALNIYTNGQLVTLNAVAEPTQAFVGWSGDLGGNSNSITVLLTSNVTAVAKFNQLRVPVITSASPAAAPPGASVTLTGTNFDPVPSNNVVRFDAVRAEVLSTSTTQLIVRVPVGATYAPISVTSSDGFTAWTTLPFAPVFTSVQPFAGAWFASKVDFSTGPNPYFQLLISDLDADGKPDLAVPNRTGGGISLLRNLGQVGALNQDSIARVVVFNTGANPYQMTAADLDGDGQPDLAIVNPSSRTLSVFRNTSTTNFSFPARADFATGTNPVSIAAADMDGDGKVDLVVANYLSDTVSVFRNLSAVGSLNTNSFATKIDFPAGLFPVSVVVADLDRDGRQDIVVANDTGGTLALLRNLSLPGVLTTNSFTAKVDVVTGGNAFGFAIGDLDGDGRPELVVPNKSNPSLGILQNLSTPGSLSAASFGPRVVLRTAGLPASAVVADVNGDARPEIVVPSFETNSVSVFPNLGSTGVINSNSFGSRLNFATGERAYAVAVGDIDGDGRPDLAVANYFNDSISILRNVIPLARPLVASNPPNREVIQGSNTTFTVAATGAAPLSYQWRFNDVNISDATSSLFQLNNVQAGNRGNYSVVITNAFGSITSATASLTVVFPPEFITQPQAQAVAPGEAVTFAVSISGTLPIAYHWRLNGLTLTNQTNATLILVNVQVSQAGEYSLSISNRAGVRVSIGAMLTVLTALEDADGDHLPDSWEFANQLNPADPSDASQDPDGDGMTSLDEFRAGTDPNDASSVLRIERISFNTGQPMLQIFARSNRTYSLQTRDLPNTGSWILRAAVPAAITNRSFDFIDTNALVGQRFYRLVTPFAP